MKRKETAEQWVIRMNLYAAIVSLIILIAVCIWAVIG